MRDVENHQNLNWFEAWFDGKFGQRGQTPNGL